MTFEQEINRLKDDKISNSALPESVVLELIVKTDGNAKEVLLKVKSVLLNVLKNIDIQPKISLWKNKLPDWFLNSFSPEMSDAQALEWLELWRALPEKEKKIAELQKGWSFTNWINWFYPDQRSWYWWNAFINDDNTVYVFILLNDDNGAAYGALKWLFVKAGAISVEEK